MVILNVNARLIDCMQPTFPRFCLALCCAFMCAEFNKLHKVVHHAV